MIVTHAPTIAHSVMKCVADGIPVSSEHFDRYVATGMRFDGAPDDLQETIAKVADPFDPDAECITFPCGCRTAYRTPFAGRTATPGGYTRYCHRDEEPGDGNLGMYALAVAVNAITAARRPGTPRGLQHAYYVLAQLPYDEKCVLTHYADTPSPERDAYTLDDRVICVAASWIMFDKPTCPGLYGCENEPLIPYLSPYHYERHLRPTLAADFATYMEVRA